MEPECLKKRESYTYENGRMCYNPYVQNQLELNHKHVLRKNWTMTKFSYGIDREELFEMVGIDKY